MRHGGYLVQNACIVTIAIVVGHIDLSPTEDGLHIAFTVHPDQPAIVMDVAVGAHYRFYLFRRDALGFKVPGYMVGAIVG